MHQLLHRRSSQSFLAVLVFMAASASACEAKRSGPAEPSSPTLTVTDLRVTGPNTLLIGETAGYTATATFSDGSSSGVGASWTSDSSAVAEISSGGQLTAWTAGSTVISAGFEGRTATLGVQVNNPLVGQWILTAAPSPAGIGRRTKTFTDTDWLVMETHPTTGALLLRHGGRYTLRGTEYSETVDFALPNTAGLIGRTFTATVNASADRFTQSSGTVTEEWSRTP